MRLEICVEDLNLNKLNEIVNNGDIKTLVIKDSHGRSVFSRIALDIILESRKDVTLYYETYQQGKSLLSVYEGEMVSHWKNVRKDLLSHIVEYVIHSPPDFILPDFVNKWLHDKPPSTYIYTYKNLYEQLLGEYAHKFWNDKIDVNASNKSFFSEAIKKHYNIGKMYILECDLLNESIYNSIYEYYKRTYYGVIDDIDPKMYVIIDHLENVEEKFKELMNINKNLFIKYKLNDEVKDSGRYIKYIRKLHNFHRYSKVLNLYLEEGSIAKQ